MKNSNVATVRGTTCGNKPIIIIINSKRGNPGMMISFFFLLLQRFNSFLALVCRSKIPYFDVSVLATCKNHVLSFRYGNTVKISRVPRKSRYGLFGFGKIPDVCSSISGSYDHGIFWGKYKGVTFCDWAQSTTRSLFNLRNDVALRGQKFNQGRGFCDAQWRGRFE